MNIHNYLDRIGYHGDVTPTLETLRRIHRAHLLAIPYENLDIHLGRDLVLKESRIYNKIVKQGRGGWCYEMNGLLAWALRELGFEVTLLGGSVNRPAIGDDANLNHLVLMVTLDKPYIADVGFGNGFLEPLPLKEGVYKQEYLTYRLKREGEYWYFTNHQYGGPGFDFTLQPYQMSDFAAQCHHLQTSPDSGFVRVAVAHRHTPDGIVTLKGAVLRTVNQQGSTEQVINTETEYRALLENMFGLHFSEADVSALWQKVWHDHQEWVASLSA